MICSVYDPSRRVYSYYECAGTPRDHGVTGTKFRKPNRPPDPCPGLGAQATIGFTPEALAFVLPPGAQPIGTGTRPRGVIAVRAGGDPVAAMFADQGGSGPALRGAMEGALAGIGDVGEPVTLPTNPPVEVEVKTNLGQTVLAACVAGIVGVLVQRAFK